MNNQMKIGNSKKLYRIDQRSLGNIVAKRFGELPYFDENGVRSHYLSKKTNAGIFVK